MKGMLIEYAALTIGVLIYGIYALPHLADVALGPLAAVTQLLR